MANKITDKKIEEMFKAYCEKQSLEHVVRNCGVSHQTATRYKKLKKWDERLVKITKKVEKKFDDSIADVKARHIKRIRGWLKKFDEYLEDKDWVDLSASDYEKLAKLELLLLGLATERTENKHTHSLESKGDGELDDILKSIISKG